MALVADFIMLMAASMSIHTSAHQSCADHTICTTVVNLHQRNTEKIIFGKLKILILNVILVNKTLAWVKKNVYNSTFNT